MQLDRLLNRIRAALQDYASEFEQRALAAEYVEACAAAARRIEQIVPLIRSGQDYQALQIAEAPPPVLDVARQLSFAEVEAWRAFCQRRGLPVAPPFDERQVDLVNQLYGKTIGESHPLYRDYRQAMRTRQEEQALRVLQSILRVNPEDANAHAEVARLSRKLAEHKLAELAVALERNDTARLLGLMESLEADGWAALEQDAGWQRAVVVREQHQFENARARCQELAGALHQLRESAQWSESLPLLAEWDALRSQFSFTLAPETESLTDAVRTWSAGLLAEQRRAEEQQHAQRELAAHLERLAGESLRPLTDAAVAARLDDLQMRIDAMAAKGAAPAGPLRSRFDDQIARVRAELKRRRLHRVGLGLAAAAVVALVVGLAMWGHFRQQRREAQINRFDELLQHEAYAPLAEALKDFDAHYADLNDDPTLSPLLARARTFVGAQASVQDGFQKDFARIDALVAHAPNPAQLAEGLAALADMEKRAAKLDAESAAPIQSAVADRRTRWTQQLAQVQEQRAATLAEIANRLGQYFAEKLPTTANAETVAAAIAPARAILAEAGAIAPNPGHESPGEENARAQIMAFTTQLDVLDAAARDALAAESQYPQAHSLEEYRGPLDRLAANPIVGDAAVASAHALLGDKFDWNNLAQRILLPGESAQWTYLGAVKDTRLQPAASAQNEDLAYARRVISDLLANTYRANLVHYENGNVTATTPVFLAGQITRSDEALTGNNVLVRESGSIINPDGTTTIRQVLWKNYNQSPSGDLFDGLQMTPESQLVARLKQAYEPRAGTIREPLLRVLDDVRADADASPILKAYLQQEIIAIAKNRPNDWGLAFSPTAQMEAAELDRLTGGKLQPADWLFPAASSHLAADLAAFYTRTAGHRYYDEAAQNLQKLLTLRATTFQFAGFVDLDQKAVIVNPPTGAWPLWGMDTAGNWRPLYGAGSNTPTAPPARLTPLLFSRDIPATP